MKKIIILSFVVTFGPVMGLVAGTVQNEKAGALKPLVAISGADSHVRKLSYTRITTSEDWTRAWVSHLGTTKGDAYRSLFEVDFERCLVVTIFRGERVNVRGIEIASVFEAADSIVIRFDELTYQTEGADNKKQPDRPYAFVVLAKTDKTIVLEEALRQYINDPPVWNECARLEARQSAARPNSKRK